jgi:hypothetical protein
MYALRMWVTRIAGAGDTLHTHKGFFCRLGVTSDPIFHAFRAFREITSGYKWANSQPYNTDWPGSPVRDWTGDVYKAFCSVSGADVLIVVLNPNRGGLKLDLNTPHTGKAYNPIDGAILREWDRIEPTETIHLPEAPYRHGMVLRLQAL